MMWNAGGEKLKCGRKPLRGTDFCRRWEADSTPYGKMRGAIPASVMKLFREKALTPTRKSTQWYARHLRWAQALYSDIKRNENRGQTHVTEKRIKKITLNQAKQHAKTTTTTQNVNNSNKP